MKITAKGYYEINLSPEELSAIAWVLRNQLIYKVKNNWINNRNNWKTYEKDMLSIIKKMFLALGHPLHYDNMLKEIDLIFEEYNKN